MILQTLTPKQTNIWIANLNKVIKLRSEVKKYHNKTIDDTEKLYLKSYGKLFQYWYGAHELSDLYLAWDGYYHTPGSLLLGRVKKLGVVPYKLLSYKRVLRWEYMNTRDEILSRTKIKWERYAAQPFQITEEDLAFYFDIQAWHTELKEILQEGEAYDETLDLDEDR